MIDTKQRILDTAERLFAQQGYDGTSLRQIIGEAGVNLAAVHYHFGAKEDLLAELVLRKIGPVNEARLALLDRVERESAGSPPVEAVLRAFLLPTAAAAAHNPDFVKLMGRLVAEGHIDRLARQHFQTLMDRFVSALARCCPALAREELGWRIHFMFGAMSRALCGKPELGITAQSDDFSGRIEKLVAFLSGGFRAPATQQSPTPAHKIEVHP